MAHIRQSQPDSGLSFQVKVLICFSVVPFSLGSDTGLSLAEDDFTALLDDLHLSTVRALRVGPNGFFLPP